MKIGAIIVLLAIATTVASAQPSKEKPGRSVTREEMSNSYKDSVEYAKIFKQIYVLIGPQKTAYVDAQEYYNRISRTFVVQGIDTAAAHKLAMAGVDNNAYEKIYYAIYREHLELADLKKFYEFLKTPEGMKVYQAIPQLQKVNNETNSYVTRLVNANVAPLRQEAIQRMQKERQPSLDQSKTPLMRRDSSGKPIRQPGTTIDNDATK